MKKIISFRKQIKGNIHTHTTRTDGEFSVDEIIKLYKKNEYSFLAITDHRIYYSQEIDYENFIVLNGCEYNCYLKDEKLNQDIHFHILTLEDNLVKATNPIKHNDNLYKSLFFDSLSQVQELINELKSRGNLIIIAHPKNKLIPLYMLINLVNYHGIEVYNTKANSDASDYSNELLINNKDIFLTSVDDSHNYYDENNNINFFRGFIVLADNILNRKNIIQAIKEKNFYASNGPYIYEIIIDKERVLIECSNVRKIVLFGYDNNHNVKLITTKSETFLNEAIFMLHDSYEFIRLECINEEKKKAWTNIIKMHY
ncbi:histidinol phosphatase-like PHP family hydrolase [Sedimentibacter acidaminivorans]|uniref:Histidinol phosphatase-like PHP family hydrolase n=1 Tax=Sedimentibacter acidaminivorans TaxID=913099 RepID=A0ABS4GC65_9FIRM|nr:hypothetical protein [Sedimentibacter acidaminivorans]MBP1925278.1 histidinol phosphatase-like PHP family hydrolase [Sedimentibacter acidaminivorans]